MLLLDEVEFVCREGVVLTCVFVLVEDCKQCRNRLQARCCLKGWGRLELALKQPKCAQQVVLIPQLKAFAQRLLRKPLDHRFGSHPAAHCLDFVVFFPEIGDVWRGDEE